MQRVEGALESNWGAVGDYLWGRGMGGEEVGAGLMGIARLGLVSMVDIEVAAACVVVGMKFWEEKCCVLGNPG